MYTRTIITIALLALAACAPAPPQAADAPPTRAPQAATSASAAPAAAPTAPVFQPGARGAPESDSSTVDLYAQAAPEFPDGLEWLNTERPLSMTELRGKVVLVDFWTYGCVNCIHNFPELKRLQDAFPNELVVIGVHSAKFANEADTANIRQVLLRYGLDHPVVNDSKRLVWRLWNVQAWPTLVLVDARGTLAEIHVGEGVHAAFRPLIARLVEEARAQGRLDTTPLDLKLERDAAPATSLSFPGRVLADPARGRVFIADTNHNRVVQTDMAGAVTGVFGGRRRALIDGDARTAAFAAPQGMALSADGATLYVADTGNHAIRRIDLLSGSVATIAGTGQQAREYPPPAGKAPGVALSSPWDLALDNGRLFIAMAGSHQIWSLDLASGAAAPFAGSGREGTADGPAAAADLAQPSGLALAPGRLFFADSESSAVRWADLADGTTHTLAGGGRNLFTFGDLDGVGAEARLQHPLALAFGGGALYVADTYNHKLKRVDPQTGAVQTLFGGERGARDGADPRFYEPAGLSLAGDTLYVADTNNHAVRAVSLATRSAATLPLTNIERFAAGDDADSFAGPVVQLDPQQLAPGAGTLRLTIELPPGYKVNADAPSLVSWRVDGAALTLADPADRSLAGMQAPLELPLTLGPGAATLSADLTVIYCAAETPTICLIDEVRLVAPLVVGAGSANTLELYHRVDL